ncbi:MAG: Arm DNA-binding domain-containing protein [Rhodoferax sp.]|nr:Arm DNA-binding domain-containing protein [Rhodoferax sp.]
MALTDTFIKNIKPTGAPTGDKHTDGQGLYLHVKAAGKYWRMSYRFDGKQKTLALGVYPSVSLAEARARRDRARKLLAHDTDPGTAKREEKQAKATAAANTFEAVAAQWLLATSTNRAAITQDKVTNWLRKDINPHIGTMPKPERVSKHFKSTSLNDRGKQGRFISEHLPERFRRIPAQ